MVALRLHMGESRAAWSRVPRCLRVRGIEPGLCPSSMATFPRTRERLAAPRSASGQPLTVLRGGPTRTVRQLESPGLGNHHPPCRRMAAPPPPPHDDPCPRACADAAHSARREEGPISLGSSITGRPDDEDRNGDEDEEGRRAGGDAGGARNTTRQPRDEDGDMRILNVVSIKVFRFAWAVAENAINASSRHSEQVHKSVTR